jgi:hypothetical protein
MTSLMVKLDGELPESRDEEKQNPESRSQKPEEKKICKSGSPPLHSDFWILDSDSCFSAFIPAY